MSCQACIVVVHFSLPSKYVYSEFCVSEPRVVTTSSHCLWCVLVDGIFTTSKCPVFVETHRTVLNQILRQSQSPLSEGPFSVLVDHMKLLDFDVKNKYFKSELQKLDEGKFSMFSCSSRDLLSVPPGDLVKNFLSVHPPCEFKAN